MMVKARKCLTKGCTPFLTYVIDTKKEKTAMTDIIMVRDFPDVFKDDLPGLPPKRKVEFRIDLFLGMTPITKTPYYLVPT